MTAKRYIQAILILLIISLLSSACASEVPWINGS